MEDSFFTIVNFTKLKNTCLKVESCPVIDKHQKERTQVEWLSTLGTHPTGMFPSHLAISPRSHAFASSQFA